MKTRIIFLIVSLVAIVSTRVSAAESRTFPADITNGNVRCVLISVGQTMVFPDKGDPNPRLTSWHDGSNGVPCFTVTYLVEQLGDAPSAQFVGGSVELSVGGKPVRIGGGGYQKCFDYEAFQSFLDFERPKVSSPKRAVIMQTVSFGVLSDRQPVSLTIKAGFGKDTQKFQFDSIRFQ